MAEPEAYTIFSGEAVILRLLGPSKHIKPIQIEILKHVIVSCPSLPPYALWRDPVTVLCSENNTLCCHILTAYIEILLNTLSTADIVFHNTLERSFVVPRHTTDDEISSIVAELNSSSLCDCRAAVLPWKPQCRPAGVACERHGVGKLHQVCHVYICSYITDRFYKLTENVLVQRFLQAKKHVYHLPV